MGTWYLPSLNQPQGVKYREHLAPVDTLVRLKLPWQSTQVLPTTTLCAVLLGGTRLNTSPVLRSLIRDLPAEQLRASSASAHNLLFVAEACPLQHISLAAAVVVIWKLVTAVLAGMS